MPRVSPASSPGARPDPEAVRAHLSQILDSPAFRGSRRSSDFLRYVVEQTLEGHVDALKERSLGVAVFERAPDYDTNQDPVVRNTAGQVRRRLAQFYQETGHAAEADGIRIELPAGSYVPDIQKIETAPVPQTAPTSEEAPPRARKSPDPLVSRLPMLALLVLAVAVAGWLLRPKPVGEDAVDRFWEPVLRQAGAVVICVGQGHTYKFSGDWDRKFDEAAAKGTSVTAPGNAIPLADVVPSFDRYVALTDMQSVLRLATMFTRLRKQIDVRGGRITGLEDIRRKPVVLVGALNNDWTLNLTGELRFYFENDGNRVTVRDRQNPSKEDWTSRTDLPINQTPTDYAIITRVFNRTTEQSVVVAAGLRGPGTEAASEFLTRADYLDQVMNKTGDLRGRNVQLVLSAKLYNGVPGPATVLATHVW